MKRFTLLLLFTVWSHCPAFAQSLPISDTSKVVSVSPKTLKGYVGKYRFDQAGIQVSFQMEGDKLMVAVPGTGQFQLIPGSKTAFFVRELGVQLEFSKKGKGPVKLYQGGAVFQGELIATEDVKYTRVLPGSKLVDYTKTFTPFTAQWDLKINDRVVGSATTLLRHAIFNGEPAYRSGSTIRYTSMDNMPFDDIGLFAKKDLSVLQARNAISQENELTTTFESTHVTQENLNLKTGGLVETKKLEIDTEVIGSGIYLLLALDIKEGLAIEYPVMGLNNIAWAKAKVAGSETITVNDKSFNAWRIEFASGTIQWIADEAPYLIKWKMPTGMEWKLKAFGN